MKLFNEEELNFKLFDKSINFEYSKEQAMEESIIRILKNLNRKTKSRNIKYIFNNDNTIEEIIN